MSRAHNKKRKLKKSKRTDEQREFARKVKQGLLPRYIFKTDESGKLERKPVKGTMRLRGGLTLRLVAWPSLTKRGKTA